ncbi:MAG: hypothetical protein RLZZ158_282 [Cyanobacteriota bacterium]|jgi:hypothetical protein
MKDGVMSDQDRENWGQGAGERQEGGRSEGGRREGAGRRGGGGGDRETGGFRIRLSDNELRAARSIQEALQLRSTVAVLGFSLRTVAQLLEQGALDEIVAQQQQQAGSRPERGERPERSDRGGERGERGERRVIGGAHQRSARPDPFARPSKPAVQEEVVEIAPELDAGADEVTASTEGANIEGASDEGASEGAASDEGASEAVTNGEPVEA